MSSNTTSGLETETISSASYRRRPLMPDIRVFANTLTESRIDGSSSTIRMLIFRLLIPVLQKYRPLYCTCSSPLSKAVPQ
jgi:hypothetical protein